MALDKYFLYANDGAAREFMALPDDVKLEFGKGLRRYQRGLTVSGATMLTQFGSGMDVIELKEDSDSDTYRCVCTIRFADAICVLASWQKKSKHGIAMEPDKERLIRRRLRSARDTYDRWKAERDRRE